MTEIKLGFLVICIGLVGWLARPAFQLDKEPLSLQESWKIFLSGFGALSVLLFLAAEFGLFLWTQIGIVLAALVCLVINRSSLRSGARELLRYTVFLLLIALGSIALYRLGPPFETPVSSDDASVFIGASFQLASSGSLIYQDPVLRDMTDQEKRAFTQNRFDRDWTGSIIRFPGGIPIVDLRSAKVGFSFYHLFPVWLAFAIQCLGSNGFLSVLSLFAVMSLASLAFIARIIAGRMAAVAVPFLLFCLYPQQYFSRMPLSEALAQPVFLSGLCLWVSALDRQITPSPREQFLVGILWGALLLCRVDMMYLLPVGIIFLFSVIPSLRSELDRWRTHLACLLVFLILAVRHQLETGTYLYLFSEKRFFGGQEFTYAILGALDYVAGFSQSHPFISASLLIGVSLATLTFGRFITEPKKRKFQWGPYPGIALVLLLLAPVIDMRVTWKSLQSHFGWFVPYFPLAVFAPLALGFAAIALNFRRNPGVYITLLTFLAIPAVCFLTRPMILPFHPLVMRRFFPIVLPLFILLSVAGIRRLSLFIPVQSTIWKGLAFALICGALSLPLFSSSRVLLRPIQTGVVDQVNRMAIDLPPDSLLVVPDSLAGLHLEIPLQYMNGFKTLLLPLDYASGRKIYPLVENYLRTRIEAGDAVVAVSTDSPAPILALRQTFLLTPAGGGKINYSSVSPAPRNQFPPKIESKSLLYSFYLLQTGSPPPRHLITYDDPEVAFLNFYEPENGFRWSKGYGLICGFSYMDSGPETRLVLKTGPTGPHPAAPRIFVNETGAARFEKQEGQYYFYTFPHPAPLTVRNVRIETRSFTPENQDPRLLGISFVTLEFRNSGIKGPSP